MEADMGNRLAFSLSGLLRRMLQPNGNFSFPRLAANLTALLALFALAGWMFSIQPLKSVLPTANAMKPNTVLGLMLAAIALFLLSGRSTKRRERLAQLIALGVAILGCATLSQYLFGWDLNIDQMLLQDSVDSFSSYAGRMSQIAALAFIMIGLALAGKPYPSLYPALWTFSALVTILGAISLLGYLWNVSDLVTSRWLQPLAVNTALCFVLLGCGTFLLPWQSRQFPVIQTVTEKRVLVGFIGTFLLLVAVGGYIYRLAVKYEQSAGWVRHSDEVRILLERFDGLISNAESMQRGFLLTGRQTYKQGYDDSIAEVDQLQQNLARLITDNPQQVRNSILLQTLIKRRLGLLARHLSLHKRGGEVQKVILVEDEIKAMQDIRQQLSYMSALELKLLTQREATLEHYRQITLLALAAIIGITVAVLTTLFLAIRRETIKRTQLESRLLEEATRLKAIFDSVVDGVITINEVGMVESFNPAAERIFGYSSSEVVGRNIRMLMPEPYQSEHDGYLARYRSTGQARIIGAGREVEGLRKDGSTFPMALSISEIALGIGRHFTGIVQDISARKNAEAFLRDSEARLRRMLEISPIGVRILRLSDTKRVFSNKAYGDIFRTTQEALIQADPSIYYQNPQEYLEICRQLEQGQDVINRHIGILGAGGEKVWVVASFIRIQYEGEPADLAWFYDITPVIQAQEKAEQANRLKTDFLSTMSHEIRTPLAGLLGMLEVLSLTQLEPEQKSKLNTAWGSARSLLRIVNDILDWSKIEEGKLHLSPQSTSIHLLLEEVVNTYSRMASSKSLELNYQVDARLSPAHIVDPLRLSQVLNNFVSNAIKFTKLGKVEIRAEFLEQVESGERIQFSVRDTGVGIPQEVQAQLFRRYQQGSADTARMYGGTGLGLAISQRLAEMMDGQVGLDSEPGQGSTFSITLTLPISAEAAEVVYRDHPEVEQRAVTPLFDSDADVPKVLAVDDHPTNRDLLSNQLRLLGLRVETAENGREALTLWREGNFAIVITDCHMPEMNGYDLAREIRNTERILGDSHIPIVAWTANALPEESEKCLAAGMDHVLVKPTSMAQLKKKLAACLSMSEENVSDTESAVVSSNTPIDHTLLDQVVPDSSAQKQVLKEFSSHIHFDSLNLAQRFIEEDIAGVEALAHRMTGSSRMVGAHELADKCQAIEMAAHEGDLVQAQSLRKPLEHALARFDAYLVEISVSVGDTKEGGLNATQ